MNWSPSPKCQSISWRSGEKHTLWKPQDCWLPSYKMKLPTAHCIIIHVLWSPECPRSQCAGTCHLGEACVPLSPECYADHSYACTRGEVLKGGRQNSVLKVGCVICTAFTEHLCVLRLCRCWGREKETRSPPSRDSHVQGLRRWGWAK